MSDQFTIHKIHDLSNAYVFSLLKDGLKKCILSKDIIENYSYDYKESTANLFYILGNGRYKTGAYYVIEKDGQYISSAGWNEYTSEIAIILSRAFVIPDYRTSYVMGKLLVPMMIEETKTYDHVWITCNEYNKSIYKWFERTNEGKRASIFSDWNEIYKRFVPIGKKIVYNTEQYIVELRK